MHIKPNNIVRKIGTNEVYEVVTVTGKIIMCNPVNPRSYKGYPVPLKLDEVEVIMEEETDAFNILFRGDPNE